MHQLEKEWARLKDIERAHRSMCELFEMLQYEDLPNDDIVIRLRRLDIAMNRSWSDVIELALKRGCRESG